MPPTKMPRCGVAQDQRRVGRLLEGDDEAEPQADEQADEGEARRDEPGDGCAEQEHAEGDPVLAMTSS
jgi:hypothetical protein